MAFTNEIPWTIIAMIFIGFVSWLYNRFQEVAAERKRRRFQQVKRAYDKQEQDRSTINTPPETVAEVKSPLQQVMDAMTGNVEEIRKQQELEQRKRELRQRQQERQRNEPAPPPLPHNRHEPVPAVPQPVPQKTVATPKGSLPKPKRKMAPIPSRRKKQSVGIKSLLRGQDSLRQALIASEVLHKPKALEDS